MKIQHRTDYRALRAAHYPSMADFADALFWREKGDPSKYEAWLKACEDVKVRFPKPEKVAK